MKRILLTLLTVAIATPALADWNQIGSNRELTQLVVNKSFVEPKSKAWFSLRSNGTLAGGFQGKDLTGTWKWDGKYVCYDRKLGGEAFPSDCIVIRVKGVNLTTTRQKGKGRTVNYVLAR